MPAKLSSVSTDLGDRIRRARQRARLTQAQLAERVGVVQRTIGGWERGENHPRSHMAVLEDVLGVRLETDFEGNDAPAVSPVEDALAAAILTYIPETRRANITESGTEELVIAAKDAINRRLREMGE